MKRILFVAIMLFSVNVTAQRYSKSASTTTGWQRSGTTVELTQAGDVVLIVSDGDTMKVDMNVALKWLDLRTGGASRFYVDSTGVVGLSDGTDTYKLMVSSDQLLVQNDAGTPLTLMDFDSTGIKNLTLKPDDADINAEGLIIWRKWNTNSTRTVINSRWGASNIIGIYTGGGDGLIDLYTSDGTTANRRMRIAADGGIFAYDLLQQTSGGLVVEYDATTKEIYAETSTQRMKKNIYNANLQVGGLFDLDVKKWIDKESGRESFGLLAEDVYKKVPELIVYNENEQPLGIKQTKLVYVLFDEVKRLKEQIQEQQTQIDALIMALKVK